MVLTFLLLWTQLTHWTFNMENTLKDLKALSPAYKDIPNGEFAYRVWESQKNKTKNLGEVTPMGIWADKHQVDNEDFKNMIAFSKTAGYDPTERTISGEHIPEDSQGRALFQGQTFGFGDEIIGGMAAGFEKIAGSDKPMGELYTKHRDNERQKMKEFRQNAPKEALAYEIGGSLLSPAMALKAPKAIKSLSAGKKAMAVSGGLGTVYGAGSSEADTVGGVASDAAFTGLTSSLFGLGVQKVIPFVGSKAKDVANWMKKAQDNPTLQTLKIAKDKAYKAVSNSKIKFGSDDLTYLLDESRKIAIKTHHQPNAEPQVKAALNIFKMLKTEGTPQSLTQLDKLRQKLAKYYAKNQDQPALKDMMDLIDKTIQRKAGKYPMMDAARIANTKYKKAEKIESAFHQKTIDKADKPYMSEASMYKEAVKSLLRNKKDIRWFSTEERKMLEKFIEGDVIERSIERTAGFAPSANKLMTMLAFAGSYFQPLFLVPTGLGMVAKHISDKSIRNKATQLINTMGGIKTPIQQMVQGAPQAAAGVTGAIQGQ